MKKSKPVCETIRPWLKENLGAKSLGALTGTDAKALDAAVQIIALYAYNEAPAVLTAFGLIVRQMQPSTQHFAYHAIAHIMDWPDRSRLWVAAGLPEFAPARCAFEPPSL